MNWPGLVSSIALAAVFGLGIWIAADLAGAATRWMLAKAEKASSEAVRAEAEAELKLARARSIDAHTDDFIRQTAPVAPTVH